MKKILLLIAAAMLVFGCVGAPAGLQNATGASVSQVLNATGSSVSQALNTTGQMAGQCGAPSYSVSGPQSTTLSSSASITVIATCAANEIITVYVDGVQAGQSAVTGDNATLEFNLVAAMDGTNNVTVDSDHTTVYSANWTVSPIGYTTAAGEDYDPISVSNWRAVAFEVSNPITVKMVTAYLMTQETVRLQNTTMIADIDSDSNGNPGSVIATGSVPMSQITMTPNWIGFPVEAQLQPGRYWVVFHAGPPSLLVSDDVNILYVTVSKNTVGDADHKQMNLVRDQQTQSWNATVWEPLAYARDYAFTVSASG